MTWKTARSPFLKRLLLLLETRPTSPRGSMSDSPSFQAAIRAIDSAIVCGTLPFAS